MFVLRFVDLVIYEAIIKRKKFTMEMLCEHMRNNIRGQ